MLRARSLKKAFFQGVTNYVINGVNLEIEEQEFVTITGKSGSGKSTLLYLLSGLEKPTSGEVMFYNKTLHRLNDKEMSELRRKAFGFVFQFFNLVSSLNVWDNICLPITIERRLTEEQRMTIVEYVKMLGIYDKLDSYPHQLSGGQQQRVAIARALAIDPDIIFADEPTGNLDSETSDDVLRVFDNLNKWLGKTIVMVTHDESITKMLATREVRLVNGRIVNY
ncbi:MAG: ABC transporter ATP-binding protein [Peptococcaceae bacterium]|nr:ABC transporter ATP-binding protein [Peptococcaceae bacterium]